MRFSDEVIRKAHLLLADDTAIRADKSFANIWWVTSSDRTKTYRVQTDYDRQRQVLTWITCTCPHGLNVDSVKASCYHVAAVLLVLLEERKAKGETPVEYLGETEKAK